jgi:hypothetical protein
LDRLFVWRNMSKYLFTLLLFCIYKADCQPIVTDASNKRIMEWDSSYQVESKYFRADYDYENLYYCSVKNKNKLFAEYFRHNNTAYLFVKYDSLGNRVQRGLIKFCNEVFDSTTVQIPDFILDPDGNKGVFKDTSLYENSYRKNGIWWEKDSVGMVWRGKYINGIREGVWEKGTLICCNEMPEKINNALFDLFRPIKRYIYEKGVEKKAFDN